MMTLDTLAGCDGGLSVPVHVDDEVVVFQLGGPWRDLRVDARVAACLLMTTESRLEVLVGAPRARVAALVGRPVEDLLVFGVARG